MQYFPSGPQRGGLALAARSTGMGVAAALNADDLGRIIESPTLPAT
jgi:hypothetical protein